MIFGVDIYLILLHSSQEVSLKNFRNTFFRQHDHSYAVYAGVTPIDGKLCYIR